MKILNTEPYMQNERGNSVSVGWGCHNKVLQTEHLNRNVLSIDSSGGWKSRLKVAGGLVPSEGSKRESPFRISPLASGGWLALVDAPLCRSIMLIFPLISTWCSPCVHVCLYIPPFLEGHLSYWIWGSLYSSMASSQLMTSATALFPNKVTS